MNRHLHIMISILLGIGVTGAVAQRSTRKNDFADLRQSLRGLQWENVDYDGLNTLERCRAVTLLDYALTEIGAVATAEADLMSEYMEQQGLGAEFASSQTAETAPGRTYEDGQKTAVALLKGPMAESRYVTMYEGTDETGLKADLRLHESASRRKWGEFSEPVRNVRGMGSFLKSEGKYQDYLVWARAESDRRQQEHEEAMAETRAAAKAKVKQSEEENKARRQELAEQRQQEEESRLAQQAIYAQSAADAQGGGGEDSDDIDDWYPRRYYRRPLNPHVRHWHRNNAQQLRARDQTQQRFNKWQGSGGTARKGGRRP